MNLWGDRVRVSIFGESHGKGIGIVIDGLPPGFLIDLDALDHEMSRRAPGNDTTSTPRREADKVEIVSGLFNGRTTGAPLCGLIQNTNTVSGDYEPWLLRPGHADLTSHYKYKGYSDYRGGGHFSGRLTAPLVFAGAVAKQLLLTKNIIIAGRISQIGNITDSPSTDLSEDKLLALTKLRFPLNDTGLEAQMRQHILDAKEKGDSVGGVVECVAINVPCGLGDPFFGSMESSISSMMFSIPAVKGIEFGAGFAMAAMCGSQANDEYYLSHEQGCKQIKTHTNNNGGLLGGITTGMPLVFRVAVKPTPSISKEQRTVNIETMEDTNTKVKGRHDPCIVPRAVPVIEAGLAIVLLDKAVSLLEI